MTYAESVAKYEEVYNEPKPKFTPEILPELEEHKEEEIFTKRSNGIWVEEGQSCKDGVRLSLLWQRHYIGPCF